MNSDRVAAFGFWAAARRYFFSFHSDLC
jgi:hypothetical protein